MNAPITVIIAGEPVAKGRARITRKGFAYTPAHTRKYEAHGRLAAQLAMDGRSPIEGPVRLELLAELPIPASWSKKKRALAIIGDVLPIRRPDLDNYLKAGLDSLNEIVLRDDSQVVEFTARKRYSVSPKLVMTIFPLPKGAGARALHMKRKFKMRISEAYPSKYLKAAENGDIADEPHVHSA